MIQQEINLNLIPSSEPVVVHCNQYDEGKSRIIAHLYNGSHPYTPGANATVKVQGTKPDNHAFQYWCDISGSTVTVDVNIQMTAVAGRTPTQLIVNETSGVTGSFAFYLDVQASTLPPDIDVSETDLPILTEKAQEAARRAVQAAGAAEDSADRAASWSSNPPYIGANFNWYVYDIATEQFVDSGILARGTNGEDGEDGERGSLWYRGTAVSGKSADPTVYPTGIADALPGDMYLNVTEGAIYHCVTGGSASVATWAYDFTLTGGGGGGGTDNYNDLINQPKVNGITLVGNKTSDDLGINSNIMLSSIMHIGGETQRTVHEALKALKDNGGGLYPYLYIDSEAGATVTVTAPDGSTIIPTPAGSGHWECELPAYGVYVIHSVLSGQGDATYSLTVDDVKEYHVTDSHYNFTIYVIADAGSTVRVSSGTEVYTGTGTGSVMPFVVHQPSTVYTIEETLDGYTNSDTVTSAASSGESATVTVHVFTATLNISTTSSSLYGKSISIMLGGSVVGSTAFNNSGQTTYAVHETGIYTLTCDGYDASVTVTTETTYNVEISTVQTYNITATIYGAASDTITYTDDNGAQTITTDSTGKAENVSITITQTTAGVDPSITFTSSVAKDPNNLSNDYSKAVTITENMTEIYVMPDNAVYWYGYKSSDYTTMANDGWTYTGQTYSNPTESTNYLTVAPSGWDIVCGIATKNKHNTSKLYMIAQGVTGSDYSGVIAFYTAKQASAASDPVSVTSTSIQTLSGTAQSPGEYYIGAVSHRDTRSMKIYAMWYE